MDNTAPEGLIEHFSKLEDPRVDRNKKHELIDVIVLCVYAVLSGAEGWCDIEEFGRTKLDWLRRYVPLANGILVDDTIARIISALSVTNGIALSSFPSSLLEDANIPPKYSAQMLSVENAPFHSTSLETPRFACFPSSRPTMSNLFIPVLPATVPGGQTTNPAPSHPIPPPSAIPRRRPARLSQAPS